MSPVDLPYLKIYRSRGRLYAYYRRAGCRIRLAGEIGSPEFLASYDAARRQVEAVATPGRQREASPLPGSLLALVQLYRSAPEYRSLGDATRASYDRHIDALLPRFGDLPVAQVPRAWVLAMRDELQQTPRAANYRVAVIKRLLSFAVEREWRSDNPASRTKGLRTGPGHRAWADSEVEAMTSEAAGDFRIPVLLALHTAQRQADVLAMTWAAYDGSAIRVRQGKQRHLRDAAEMAIPVHPILRTVLDAERERQRAEATARNCPVPATICVTNDLRPWKADWFKHRFAATRATMGLPTDLHFHGLRHSAASRLAEAGASDAEIQAITGHRTRAMVAHYTAGARQKSLAKSGMARLSRKRTGNQSV
ncbi:Tyrosine-type recombinase/integrase [Rhodovastum atsumiense]|nr:tyrosine-type recombinase/integrase [Rhodovastum atsumiense]CAH2603807.1 Tyrosine-type recombinase/integrase [Rhodovastum atsumiense]